MEIARQTGARRSSASAPSAGGRRRGLLWATWLGALMSAAALSPPDEASADPCPKISGTSTAWIGGSGSLGADANWTNGTPSGSCDVSITAAGDYTVSMTGGANVRSLVLGGPGSTPHLVISDESPNTNLDAQPAGITIAAGASVTLTCQPGGCPAGGPDINTGSSPFVNAGTITVDANSGTGALVGGAITNTGTIAFENIGTLPFEQTASLSGVIVNKGAINISTGANVLNSGSSCGNEGPSVKNDTGGTITANGTGRLSVVNYEQGNGSVGGTSAVPINIPCGSLKYTGTGASKVQATGGFNLSGGEMQSNQSLTVLGQSANTNAVLKTDFTNKGSITLSCSPPGGPPPPFAGCSGGDTGGAGFNVAGHQFTNAGTFTVAAASGDGASLDSGNGGTITNTGTMQFDQSARLLGSLVNQGSINIADGKAVSHSGNSCSPSPLVKNDTGGSINASGTGALFTISYEQGNGTTTGDNPVQMGGGCLKYSGNGASEVLVTGGFDLSGEMQAGQSLTVTNNSANTNLRLVSPFTSKGSITFTCPSPPCNGPGFNSNGNIFTNAGTFTVDAAASSGTSLDMGSIGMTNATSGTFQLNGNTNFTNSGTLSNQGTLRIVAGANTPSFTNAGTIVLDQSATNPFLNTGTLTNTGTITTSGASANMSSLNGTVDQTGASAQVIVPTGTELSLNNPLLLKAGKLSGGGTLQGSVNNSGGSVAPGASPGTLSLSGDYTQGAGGKLEIEIGGTGAGQFDELAIGGNATLDGTLALQPAGGYPDSSAVGDSVTFLTYGGTRAGPFAATTVSSSLACPKQLAAAYDDAGKKVNAVVSNSGAVCPSGGGGSGGGSGGSGGGGSDATTPPPPVPSTKLGAHPSARINTKKKKLKVKFGFSSDVAGATFQCKLDKGPYKPCKAPAIYKVKPGRHTFKVRANGPGGTDPTPISFSFKVVRQPQRS